MIENSHYGIKLVTICQFIEKTMASASQLGSLKVTRCSPFSKGKKGNTFLNIWRSCIQKMQNFHLDDDS